MQSIFEIFEFDNKYSKVSFPGQAADERILYVTRESPMVLLVRLTVFMLIVALGVLVGALLVGNIGQMLEVEIGGVVMAIVLVGAIVMGVGIWWIGQVFNKTLFVITTRRLTKFIHTTPWTRYQMSLGLDKVIDSGAYSKGYVQAIFGLGTFVARSSAGNIKNFKIENIHFAEDLHNWMNKLMFVFNKNASELDSYKPFVAKPKGKRE